MIQRGVRGIFIGSPSNQAGWHIFVPQSGTIATILDIAFGDHFVSAGLCYNCLLFHDALPTHSHGPLSVDVTRFTGHTGPP